MIFNIVIFLFVLGLMIFFHEMGHFIAAKACNVYCERFSLGMPPRLVGVRLGETDYCLGALPFGGYVKMAGQEDVPMTDEEREETYTEVPPERWFNKRPLWQRMIIIAAGPLMNVVLAVILYGIVAGLGAEVPETDVDSRIGEVLPGSPAASAPMYLGTDTSGEPDATGWQTGDRIVSVDGHAVGNIMDVAMEAVLGANTVLDVVIERTNRDGVVETYLSPVAPKASSESEHARFGVAPFDTALIDYVMAGSPAAELGLKKGDIIERANGKIVDGGTFVQLIEDTPQSDEVSITVRRGDERFTDSVYPRTVGRLLCLLISPHLDMATHETDDEIPVVARVLAEQEYGNEFKRGDIIEKADGEPITRGKLSELARMHPGETVQFQIRRMPILWGLLRSEQVGVVNAKIEPVSAIGIQLGVKRVFHRVPAGQVVPEAFRQTRDAVRRTLETVAALVMGKLSPKSIGGPVLIYQVTTAAAHAGYTWLLKITAFVSVNLCIFNLLPLPILDGGLLLCFAIEGVRRKPLEAIVLERFQQVGLVLIIGLMLFVTFNDISRVVANLVP